MLSQMISDEVAPTTWESMTSSVLCCRFEIDECQCTCTDNSTMGRQPGRFHLARTASLAVNPLQCRSFHYGPSVSSESIADDNAHFSQSRPAWLIGILQAFYSSRRRVHVKRPCCYIFCTSCTSIASETVTVFLRGAIGSCKTS
jgi:hypothetical protein